MGRQTAALDPKLTSAPVVTISGVQTNELEANFFQKLCTTYGVRTIKQTIFNF